jgi:lipoprotein-anchoring transpeptidase ErfK/SrfK
MRIAAGATTILSLIVFAAFGAAARAQLPMPSINKYLQKQPPAKVDKEREPLITPNNSHVVVSLSKQRAFLMFDDQVYIDTPISSGKAGHTTPSGSFHVLEKDPNHSSSIYGQFQDKQGRVVRDGVSLHSDSAPAGTHYVGAPMRWFMRLTDQGVGMHVGILPGYAASHGCVRLPADIAKLIYDKVKVGTPVEVQP